MPGDKVRSAKDAARKLVGRCARCNENASQHRSSDGRCPDGEGTFAVDSRTVADSAENLADLLENGPRRLLGGMLGHLRQETGDALRRALGGGEEPPDGPPPPEPGPAKVEYIPPPGGKGKR